MKSSENLAILERYCLKYLTMSRSQLFLASLIAFLIGIALQGWFPRRAFDFGMVAVTYAGLSAFLLYSRRRTRLLATSLIIASAAFGICRGQLNEHIPSEATVDFYASEERNRVTLVGTIAEEADVRRNKVNYTIEVQGMKNGETGMIGMEEDASGASSGSSRASLSLPGEREVSGYTLISTGKYPRYEYGDRLEVTGHLQHPVVFDTFDYAGYLSRFEIYSVMYRPRLKSLQLMNESAEASDQRFFDLSVLSFLADVPLTDTFFRYMLGVKKSFEDHMNRTFSSEPSSSFMAGLLLGSRKGIPDALNQDFQITGLSHIIAISGYNITLLVTIFMALFRPLGKKWSIIVSSFAVILFTFFVGASPAVVRACLMGLIALVALNSERKGNITIGLVLTAALMIGYNPKILVHDVGFQLSFLATMGLIYVSPLIEPWFTWLPKSLAIRESILLTMSAQIMALPIILLNFQKLSLVSPLSNLLVAGPVIPLAMLFGFVGTMISYVWLPLAKLFAYPGYLVLQYIVGVIRLTARIPYASVEVNWFSQPLLFTYFVGLSMILLRIWARVSRREQRIVDEQVRVNQLVWHRVYGL